MGAGDMDVVPFLRRMCDEVERSAGTYMPLLRKDVPAIPIPFFGKINSASVLTVGVNPSPGEFGGARIQYWENISDTTHLAVRLTDYFNGTHHPWFDTWRKALALLDVSYEKGRVAHVDLSPRATIPMAQVQDINLFLAMVRHDIKWFFEILSELSSIKLVLLAGSVTKKHYINNFIKKSASEHGYRFDGTAERTGKGRIGNYEFINNGKAFSCFYCSVSPSSRSRGLLIERIGENSTRLKSLIHGTDSDV
ncbi:MAG TPA: hypothetical protein PLQ64_08750 [Thiobacillaceae bacterium]|nr:hypothetical protein [Thiobacillaceae bacterium]HNH90205.1 hypothetical protein [Thiobacillaceae bacterium]HNI07688.1 hypothetical protein [Thiobacillaceae bacterium]